MSEPANLTPEDVDTEERVLRVVLGNGRKDRKVPLRARSEPAHSGSAAPGLGRAHYARLYG